MSNKQTALDFLLTELDIAKIISRENLTMAAEVVRQAKEMHKQEIINAIDSFYHYKNGSKDLPTKGEQYYKETFVK